MARIRPYENQVSAQGDLPSRSANVSDFGGQGLVNLGTGLENVGADAGQIQRFMNEAKAQREVTDAQTKITQLSNDLTMMVDDRARKWQPGDPYLSDVMPGVIKGQLDNLGYNAETGNEVYETQAGSGTFQRLSEKLRLHMTQTLKHVDGELAGKAAQLQYNQTVDSTGNFLYTHPSYFDLRREEVAEPIRRGDGIYARVPAVEREKLARAAEEKMAINAIEGLIRKTPNRALEILQDPLLAQDDTYGWISKYIPNEKHEPLTLKAQTAVHTLEVEARQAEAERRRQEQELHHATDTDLMAKYALGRSDPKAPKLKAMDVYDALSQNKLDGPTGRALINMLDADARGGNVKTDPATEHALFRRIHAEYGSKQKLVDATPIYDAFTGGKLSWESMTHLRKEFEEARTEEGSKLGQAKAAFLEGQKHMIDKSLVGRFADALGAEKFANFKFFVQQEEDRMRKENKDPYLLYNPDAKEYLGKHTERFMTGMQESLEYIQKRITLEPGLPKTEQGAVEPDLHRKEGETIDQWRKRTGK